MPIYEVGEHEGRPFFSMKLVEGGSLSSNRGRFRDDPAPPPGWSSTLARAVHYAHGAGFLHCDLKPSNVLLDGHGKPYVTDFGLARGTGEDSSLSISGAILGTPSYMAPEQAAGSRARLGPATDVYGLGAILYELLTGRPPFRSPTIMETVVQVLERDPAPPRELRPEVPRELEGICLKCLEKSPKDRYPSAEALAEELDHYLQGEGSRRPGSSHGCAAGTVASPSWSPGWAGWVSWRSSPRSISTSSLASRPAPPLDDPGGTRASGPFVAPLPDAPPHGFRSDRVRVLWSAADIVCMTIVTQALWKRSIPPGPGWPAGACRDDVARRIPAVDRGLGALVATQSRLDHDCDGNVGLQLDFTSMPHSHGTTAGSWEPSPDLLHPNIFLAGFS